MTEPVTPRRVASSSAIQLEADYYAETVLRYFSSGDDTIPAMPDPEATTYDVVLMYIEDRWDVPQDTAKQMAGAAVGFAREALAL